MAKKNTAAVATIVTKSKASVAKPAKKSANLITEDGRLKTLAIVQAEAEAEEIQGSLDMTAPNPFFDKPAGWTPPKAGSFFGPDDEAPRVVSSAEIEERRQRAVSTDLDERRQAAASKMNNATKATSAHAYALVGCDGDTTEERLDAMRAKLSQWNEGIRRQACKLAMSSKAQPGSTTASLLKQLHDEQPAVSAPTAATKSSGGGGRVKRDANEAREIKVTEADGRAILSRLRLSDLFTGCKSIRVEVTPEGMMITPVR